MSKEERVEKLTLLLKDLFQFENNDLDFGIYRIINIKRKEISEFIDTELFEIIKEKIKTVEDNTELQKNLESLKKEIETSFGCDILDAKKKYAETPKVKDYIEREKELKLADKENDIEEEIYDDIISFFSRYYDKGDFISKRRYSKDSKYAIPYNGEEVYLYWANNDQYYIKTAENFKNYSFKVGSLKVNFEIIGEEVDVEKNNIKDVKRKFFIFYDAEYDQNNRVVNVRFGYRGLTEDEENTIMELTDKKRIGKDEVNIYNLQKIQEKIGIYGLSELQQKHIKMDGEKSDSSELKWHLNKYTTKNTSDYFIHKELKKFLKQELDFYIKNELLHIDDIDTKENLDINLKQVKIFKEISLKIIEFLAQIEDFQKKLWEKKKFVISTDYCITLDYIDEKYYSEILNNEKQLEEWKKLYSFDIETEVKKLQETLSGHGINDEEKKVEILKQNPTLIIDTKFYDVDFKYQLLSEIDNLDEKTIGILINSDNFQALNLLLNKYKEKIKCCYIDPPYNTGNDGFLYKDSYKHSCWLTLMSQSLTRGINLLNDFGMHFVSIDDNECHNLKKLSDLLFDQSKFKGEIIRGTGTPTAQGTNNLANELDYILVYSKNNDSEFIGLPFTSEDKKRYNMADKNGKFLIRPLRKTGSEDKREDRPNMYYEINSPDGTSIYPIGPTGYQSRWRVNKERYEDMFKNSLIYWKQINVNDKKEWRVYIKFYLEGRTKRPSNLWIDIEGNKKAQIELFNLFGSKMFSNPKPTELIRRCISICSNIDDIILDYFAGSGSTGHAVLNLNKEDKGDRKFILIEMGQYFNSVLKPRILKVIYSDNWKEGKPQDNNGLKKQIIKYQTLEQYEDSLNNIDFKEPTTLVKKSKDYKIKYMLEFETKQNSVFLNLSDLESPFKYKLKAEENNEIKEYNVDLIETFNYIYGIDVKSIRKKQDKTVNYVIVKGQRDEKDIVIIWRDKSDNFNPEQDKKFIETEILTEEFDEILINGNSLVQDAKSIDEIFKANMFRG